MNHPIYLDNHATTPLDPAGAGRHAPLLPGQIRQCRQPQSWLWMGGRKGRGDRAPPDCQSGRSRRARNRLHQRRHRVRQSGHQGGAGGLPRQGKPRGHHGDRAPGSTGPRPPPGTAGLPGDHPSPRSGRPARSCPPPRRHPSGHRAGQRDVRQQRNRSGATGPRDRRHLPRAGRLLPLRRRPGVWQDSHPRGRGPHRPDVAERAQTLWPQGNRRALYPPRASRACL